MSIKRSFNSHSLLFINLLWLYSYATYGQDVPSTSDFLIPQAKADRQVYFDLSETGISKTIKFGADLAWAHEQNFRRVILFAGKDQLDIVRASFQPTHEIVNGQLHQEQLNDLNYRLYLINTFAGSNIDLQLNSDHPSVDPWYNSNAANWTELIQVTAQKFIDAGHNVVTIAPFNEPDYSVTGQGTIQDFYNIVVNMRQNSFFDGIRISGGNTLNNDVALEWYEYLVPAGINEGNTHQLAGSFDSYAKFYEEVSADGNFAANDELHNVMEALVGYEYGMQSGIWWGPAEYARGEMVKAMDGERLGYAEHRPNWTAAAVYRHPDGRVQAFCGESERQSVTTTYQYVSKDRAVFYDGHGPSHTFFLEMPAAPNSSYYQNAQWHPNAERVINITWGDDIQPVINGRYKIVNKNSGKVLMTASTSTADGTNIVQGTYSGSEHQQWDVTPVDSRIGGDFSYYEFRAVNSGKTLNDLNYSLDNGGNIILYNATESLSANEQRYLEYAGDGYFYIRSRHSSLCMDVANASSADGANVHQWEVTGGDNQLWKLLPIDAEIESTAPYANPALEVSANSESIELTWPEIPVDDLAGYIVLRSETSGGPYQTIARNLDKETERFVDNTVLSGVEYFYIVKSIDHSLNVSDPSNEVSATANGEKGLIAHYSFEGVLVDSTENLMNGASYGTLTYDQGIINEKGVTLNGDFQFIQLPAGIADEEELSISTWVLWNGGDDWQRVFDFGNGEEEYMMLTASTGGRLVFEILYDGQSVKLDAPALVVGEWTHVAVTMEEGTAYLYVNGTPVDIALDFTIRPIDISPVMNFLGRSQWAADPMFNGTLDDMRIYNYAIGVSEVEDLADTSSVVEEVLGLNDLKSKVWPVPAHDQLNVHLEQNELKSTVEIFHLNGDLVLTREMQGGITKLDVSELENGLYILIISNDQRRSTSKVLINH